MFERLRNSISILFPDFDQYRAKHGSGETSELPLETDSCTMGMEQICGIA